MSWHNNNQFQHPPPGVFPPSTSSRPSLLGPCPLSGQRFQQTCPPPGSPYFIPNPHLMVQQTMPYFPPGVFYNTAQFPSTLIGSSTTYPFQMQWTEQRNTYSLPPPNNHFVPTGEGMYSFNTDQPALERNISPRAYTGAEACVIHEEQSGQEHYQQQVEGQEHGFYEEGKSKSSRQRQCWGQRQDKSKSEGTNNHGIKEKQITHQGDSKQRNNNLDVREDRGFNPHIKRQEHKKHEEERQKTAGQTQSRGQHKETRKLNTSHNQTLRSKQPETPRTQQHGYQQFNNQTDINQGPDLNPPKCFYPSKTYSKSNLKANSGAHCIPPVTKHKQRPYSAGHPQGNDKDGEMNSNARSHIDRGSMNQALSNSASNKRINKMLLDTTGRKLTHTSNPIPEFVDMQLNTDVILDEYCSDLNADIGQDGCDMATMNTPLGFRLLYAGAKANVGVSKGRVFFEAKITENLMSRTSVSWDEAHPNIARIGWSGKKTSLELGEENMSFGYDSSGKFSTNDIYNDYGKSFQVDDVIGALIDLDSKPGTISFMKNGEHLGIATSFSAHYVDEEQEVIMFPHVYLKNCKIDLNFGQRKPWFSPQQGYKYISHLQLNERVNSLKPQTRQTKEVIMTVGLPGAGKTTWAKKQQQENPGKQYYILGTDQLMDKMRVVGLPRTSYSEKFETLYNLADECFKVLLDIASKSNRNYILDQTNVFLAARERKMQGFSKFHRTAVVVQPCDQELLRRSRERTEKFGKSVPLLTLREMRAKYSLPSGSTWDEIIYTELDEHQTRALVKQYNCF